ASKASRSACSRPSTRISSTRNPDSILTCITLSRIQFKDSVSASLNTNHARHQAVKTRKAENKTTRLPHKSMRVKLLPCHMLFPEDLRLLFDFLDDFF